MEGPFTWGGMLIQDRLGNSWVDSSSAKMDLRISETHLKSWIQFWAPQHKKDIDLLKWYQQRAVKMIEGLEHLSYEETESLKKRWLRAILSRHINT